MLRGQEKKKQLTLVMFACAYIMLVCVQSASAQRGEDDGDDDESGFDDSGYNQSPSHDAEGSNQNQNYSPSSEEDLDDDDDVDETHMSPQVAPESHANERNNEQMANDRNAFYGNVGPQRFYSAPNSVLLANVDPASISYNGRQDEHARYRRSTGEREGDIEDDSTRDASERLLVRRKRHSKYIGPVYTYVKTDKHAHYKWGVKHKVGKHHGR